MKGSRADTTFTDISNCNYRLSFHASPEQHTRHYRNHVAEVRYWTNEALFHIAEMYIEISAARRSSRLRHVLSKNISRSNPFYQHSAEVADQWCNEIPRL